MRAVADKLRCLLGFMGAQYYQRQQLPRISPGADPSSCPHHAGPRQALPESAQRSCKPLQLKCEVLWKQSLLRLEPEGTRKTKPDSRECRMWNKWCIWQHWTETSVQAGYKCSSKLQVIELCEVLGCHARLRQNWLNGPASLHLRLSAQATIDPLPSASKMRRMPSSSVVVRSTPNLRRATCRINSGDPRAKSGLLAGVETARSAKQCNSPTGLQSTAELRNLRPLAMLSQRMKKVPEAPGD